jgi:hypothetical protein
VAAPPRNRRILCCGLEKGLIGRKRPPNASNCLTLRT